MTLRVNVILFGFFFLAASAAFGQPACQSLLNPVFISYQDTISDETDAFSQKLFKTQSGSLHQIDGSKLAADVLDWLRDRAMNVGIKVENAEDISALELAVREYQSLRDDVYAVTFGSPLAVVKDFRRQDRQSREVGLHSDYAESQIILQRSLSKPIFAYLVEGNSNLPISMIINRFVDISREFQKVLNKKPDDILMAIFTTNSFAEASPSPKEIKDEFVKAYEALLDDHSINQNTTQAQAVPLILRRMSSIFSHKPDDIERAYENLVIADAKQKQKRPQLTLDRNP